jgi:hypothetical protein
MRRLCVVFMLVVVVGVLGLVRTSSEELRAGLWGRLPTKAAQVDPCPDTAFVHQSGEPTSYESRTADFRILSGGANISPEKSVFFPMLVAIGLFTEKQSALSRGSGPGMKTAAELGILPIRERKYADVVFRSALCDARREELVAVVRRAVESANFTFKVKRTE